MEDRAKSLRPRPSCSQLTKRGLEGDDAAARASLAVIEEARGSQGGDQPRLGVIVVELVAPGSVTSALEPLRMARKLDPYRETARIALEPWRRSRGPACKPPPNVMSERPRLGSGQRAGISCLGRTLPSIIEIIAILARIDWNDNSATELSME